MRGAGSKALSLWIVFAAASALGSELSVRLEEQTASDQVSVSLVEACSSFDCGLRLLGGGSAPAPTELTPVLDSGWPGTVRVVAPVERDAWLVVVDSPDRMPMVMPWRPSVARGDLAPVPQVEVSVCRVTVLNEGGETVSGATVVGLLQAAERRDEPRDRPSLFPHWRPWIPSTRTDSRGGAALQAPRGSILQVGIQAPGYRNAAATCRAGSSAVVRLKREALATVEFRDTGNRLLVGGLVRDETGLPVALSNERGRAALDRLSVLSARLWLELPGGAVYEAVRLEEAGDGSPDRLIAREVTTLQSGTLGFDAGAAISADVFVWTRPTWPWPRVHSRAMSATVRVSRSMYGLKLLPEDQLWIAAEGFGYSACERTRVLADSWSDVCPPTLRAAPEIEAVVTDEAGEPLADVEVRFEWPRPRRDPTVIPGNRGFGSQLLVRSDHAGRAVTRRVPYPWESASSVSPIWVRAERHGYLPIPRQVLSRFATEEGSYRVVMRRGTRVSGRIVEAGSGEPVPSAEVGVGWFAAEGRTVILGSLEPELGRYGQVRTTLTDVSGQFAVVVGPGRYDVVVRAPDRAFRMVRGVEVGEAGRDLGEISLKASLELRGVVLDQQSLPIAEARIVVAGAHDSSARGHRWTDAYIGSRAAREVGTDAEGRFAISGLSRGSVVDLLVTAPGLADERFESVAPTLGIPLRVVLQPEARVAGTVVYSGRPVSTWVELGDSSRPGRDGDSMDSKAVLSDEKGLFEFSGLDAGYYSVVAMGVQGLEPGRGSVKVLAGETGEVTLELGDAQGRLVGRVTEDGAPLSGVEVRTGDESTATDGAGRYFFDGLTSGRRHVSARYARSGSESVERQDEIVSVSSGSARLDFDFSLFDVSGRAAWAGGAPAGDAKISFLRRTDALSTSGVEARTDGDGSFAVRLARGTYAVLGLRPLVSGGGSWRLAKNPLRVRHEASQIRVRFGREMRVAGVVRGLAEEELAGLQVWATSDQFEMHYGQIDAEGRFQIDGLDEGSWLVVASSAASRRRAERRVVIDDEDVFLSLEFEQLAQLSGVVFLDGRPLHGTRLVLMQGRDLAGARRIWTRRDGSYSFPDLEPGNYTLGVGSGTRSVLIRGDDVQNIELRSATIDGSVVDPRTGAVQSGAVVRIWPVAVSLVDAKSLGIVRRSYTDADGRFAFGQIPEGSWSLEVEDVEGAVRRLELEPGAVVRLQLP